MLLGELAALLESANDLITFRQIIDFVSARRMRFDREYLAVHSETADVHCRHRTGGRQQGVGILQAQTAQLGQGVGPFHLADGGGGRRGELDRLIPKHAAEAESNHGLPQFMAVIESCSTVASETHTK